MSEFLSNIIGKKCIKSNGELVGTVFKLTANKDYTKIKNIYLFDEKEEEIVFSFCSIEHIGSGGIIMGQLVKGLKIESELPLGIFVIDKRGNDLGQVIDFEFDGNSLNYLITTKGKYQTKKVEILSKEFIILNLEKNTNKPEKKQAENTTPMLTGKKIKKPIYNNFGELIIAQGTLITPDIVKRALNNGKLFELTLNTLMN